MKPCPYPYTCNIDLSKPTQVQGVTNLANVPIHNVHTSVPYNGNDGQIVTSALTGVLDTKPRIEQPQRSYTSNLDLNLI